VAVLASVSGVRIECDECADHVHSPDLTIDQLRRAAGYVRIADRDRCPVCAAGLAQADWVHPPRSSSE
jgi:hypothetical protein